MSRLLGLLTLACLLTPGHAMACKCKIQPSIEEAMAEADVVVVARAIAYESADTGDEHIIFETTEVLKGEVTTKKFTIRGGKGKDCNARPSRFPLDRVFVLAILGLVHKPGNQRGCG